MKITNMMRVDPDGTIVLNKPEEVEELERAAQISSELAQRKRTVIRSLVREFHRKHEDGTIVDNPRFISWAIDTYGIKPIWHLYLDDFEIVDEKLYLLFILKYL
jgi:hypothetical protein